MKRLEQVNYAKILGVLILGIIIWILAPFRPSGISLNAWHMLAIFVATIAGCIIQALPLSGVTIVSFVIMILTGVVPLVTIQKSGHEIEGALSAFSNSAAWLVVIAYMISRGIIKTGLGKRIALYFIKWFGKKTIGLGYAIGAIDFLVSPATPSNAARAGGIVYPLILSLANAFNSKPNEASSRKIGSYLIFTEYQINVITSALFLTAAAPNLVAVAMAQKIGINITWIQWFLCSLVPSLICLVTVPFLIYKLNPPEIKASPNAKDWAEKQLKTMGKLSLPEIMMSLIFILTLSLWALASVTGMNSTLIAFISLALLILSGVLSVDDVLEEKGAWNILIWFSILVFMAGKLTEFGLIAWAAKEISGMLNNLNWLTILIVLALIMFYAHYFFASETAQNSALYLSFLSIAIAAGAPKLMAAMYIAMFTAIMGSTTNYASTASSVLSSAGFVKIKDWWKGSFIMGLYYIMIYGVIGLGWMKVIGMW